VCRAEADPRGRHPKPWVGVVFVCVQGGVVVWVMWGVVGQTSTPSHNSVYHLSTTPPHTPNHTPQPSPTTAPPHNHPQTHTPPPPHTHTQQSRHPKRMLNQSFFLPSLTPSAHRLWAGPMC